MKKPVKGIVAAGKGFTLTAMQLKFALGLFIAVIVLFGVWMFLFRNAYERAAEENFRKLYRAIDATCSSAGEKQTINFYLPQQAGFKGWVYQLVGISGANVGADPYFYVYWERFPPEPPPWYETGVIVAPWSEDLPWSSNLLLTAALNLGFFGIDFFNVKGLGSAAKWNLQKLWHSALDSEKLSKIKPLLEAIDKGLDYTLKYGGKLISIKSGKLVLREGVYLSGATAIGAVLCMVTFEDKTLSECAMLSAGGWVALRSAYKIGPHVYSKIQAKISERQMKIAYDTIEKIAYDHYDEGFKVFINELKDAGIVEEQAGKLVVKKGEFWDALEQFWIDKGKPENIEFFEFVQKDGILKRIDIAEQLKDSLRSKILYPIEKELKELVNKLLHREFISSEGLEIIGEQLRVLSRTSDPTEINALRKVFINAKEAGRSVPFNVYNDKELLEYIRKQGDKIIEQAKLGKVLLMEKDTKLIHVFEADTRVGVASRFNELLLHLAQKDKEEAARLFDLIRLKEFRIKERIAEVAKKGSIGYSFLRFQDLYTPLGVTYWDKQVSFYTFSETFCKESPEVCSQIFEKLKLEKKPFTESYCAEEHLCLQMGFYVVNYPLPESCQNAGVTEIRLKRDSIIAKDPRFYLVSPCFSRLDIWKQDSTVYIEPKICSKRPKGFEGVPNYCFATAGTVNFYVTSELVSFIAPCIAGGICAGLEAIATAGIALPHAILEIGKSCAKGLIKGPPTGPCSLLADTIRLFSDFTRDTIVNYPYIPEWVHGSTWEGEC